MQSPLMLNDVVIRWIAVSEMQNNVYLLTSPATGQQILIDAADDIDAIAALLASGAADGPGPKDEGNRLDLVITTHRHWDHIRALEAVVESTGAAAVAGENDADAIQTETGVRVGQRWANAHVATFDGFSLSVIELRGHTPGSIAIVLEDSSGTTVIFSGDSLFPGGPGKTSTPEDFTSLMDDLESRVFGRFADDTVVFPGHGAATTLGAERPQLSEWRARGW